MVLDLHLATWWADQQNSDDSQRFQENHTEK